MKNTILNDIKKYAIQRLQQEYGYCGLAEGDNFAMINSGNGTENITINFNIKNDDENCETTEQP